MTSEERDYFMVEIVDECVGCPPEMGCLGSTCPNRNVEHYYCDRCGAEETLYEVNGEQLCKECLTDVIILSGEYPIVEGSEL